MSGRHRDEAEPAGAVPRAPRRRRRGRAGVGVLAAVLAAATLIVFTPAAVRSTGEVAGRGQPAGDGLAVAAAGSAPAATPTPTPPATPAPTRARPNRRPVVPRATPATPSRRRVAPSVTYTYSLRTVGAVTTDPRRLAAVARAAYADPRGWSLGGRIAFREVPSGGDFTLWLASADRMSGFGPPCDSTYSCRSGRNVVVNEDRWRTGSPTGVLRGDLPTYRLMVVNHETGHWLGLKHRGCPAPGAPAPVMQQQSIDLAGCRPNPWPTGPELDTVRAAHVGG